MNLTFRIRWSEFSPEDAEIRGHIDASGRSFHIRISGGELRDVSL